MKTAVSIPDDVYTEAEQLVRRLGKSRSQLYTEALREYLSRHDPDAVTEALNRLADEFDTRSDPAVAAAAIELFRKDEW